VQEKSSLCRLYFVNAILFILSWTRTRRHKRCTQNILTLFAYSSHSKGWNTRNRRKNVRLCTTSSSLFICY